VSSYRIYDTPLAGVNQATVWRLQNAAAAAAAAGGGGHSPVSLTRVISDSQAYINIANIHKHRLIEGDAIPPRTKLIKLNRVTYGTIT